MPATGVSGVDLYVKSQGKWRWLAVGQPQEQTNTAVLINNVPAGSHEYLLYLPLYNGVTSVEVGVPQDATLQRRTLEEKKPIVFWGTSITQGGCASRPGMVHTAILGRWLDYPVVNLGFSGNGRMEPEVAEFIAEIDASLFVIDCLPNITEEVILERTRPLVTILRSQRPDTPILLVEDRSYTNSFFQASKQTRNSSSRRALRSVFQAMQRDGIEGLHYLEGDNLLGADGEDTVDGSHPTDLGFLRQAHAFRAVIAPILAGSTVTSR